MSNKNAIRLEHNADKILGSFNQLLSKTHNLTPAMRAIEGILASASERAFAEEATPSGEKWEDITDLTKTQRQEQGYWPGKILQRTGRLASSVETDSTSTEASIGTNAVYAALMFHGGTTSPDSMIPNKEIAAREFLGIGPNDEDEILAIFQTFLAEISA